MEESRLKQEADSKKSGERMEMDTNQRKYQFLFFLIQKIVSLMKFLKTITKYSFTLIDLKYRLEKKQLLFLNLEYFVFNFSNEKKPIERQKFKKLKSAEIFSMHNF